MERGYMGRNHSRFRVLVLLICCAVLAAGAIYWPALAAEVGEDPESPAESGETQEAPAETSLEDMSLEELREYIKQNTVRQEQLEDQKAALEGEIDNAEAEIGLLESQMSLIQEQITMIEQGIQTAQATIDDLELQIAATEEDLAEHVHHCHVTLDRAEHVVQIAVDELHDGDEILLRLQRIVHVEHVLVAAVHAQLLHHAQLGLHVVLVPLEALADGGLRVREQGQSYLLHDLQSDQVVSLLRIVDAELTLQHHSSLDAPCSTVPDGLLRPVVMVLCVHDVISRHLRARTDDYTLDCRFAQLHYRLASTLEIFFITAGKRDVQCWKCF